eukprot:scaffold79_cov259-Pinguiococcus_pyrenoidosus.AAC.9
MSAFPTLTMSEFSASITSLSKALSLLEAAEFGSAKFWGILRFPLICVSSLLVTVPRFGWSEACTSAAFPGESFGLAVAVPRRPDAPGGLEASAVAACCASRLVALRISVSAVAVAKVCCLVPASSPATGDTIFTPDKSLAPLSRPRDMANAAL